MTDAIGASLSFAVGVALSPLPIVAVVLLLSSPRGRATGPAFLAGWIAGLALLGAIVLLVSSGAGAQDGGEPATWLSVLKLVLGLALWGFAGKLWRDRPRGDEVPAMPGWMSAVDSFTPGRAFAIAAALAAVNPKNALLTIGGAATIAQAGLDTGESAASLAVFVLVAAVGVGAPVILSFVLGERSARMLDELRTWMARNNTVVMAVIGIVIGAKLIGDAIAAL